jgi:hypothetical protein
MENEKEGFPLISLREIKVLMQSEHPNVGSSDFRLPVVPPRRKMLNLIEYVIFHFPN